MNADVFNPRKVEERIKNIHELRRAVRLIVQKVTCTLIVGYGEVISFDLIRGPGLGQNLMDKGNFAKRIIGYLICSKERLHVISNNFEIKVLYDV